MNRLHDPQRDRDGHRPRVGLKPGELRLSEAQVGQRLRIEQIEGGRRLQARLIGMGLPLGSEVMVLHNRGGGIVLAAGTGRLALGQGMAHKLIASPLP